MLSSRPTQKIVALRGCETYLQESLEVPIFE
jgi:hypothetical protein